MFSTAKCLTCRSALVPNYDELEQTTIRQNPLALQAHQDYLDMEEILVSCGEGDLVDRKRLINVGIRGYLLREGPTDTAVAHVAQGLVQCKRSLECMVALGGYYEK